MWAEGNGCTRSHKQTAVFSVAPPFPPIRFRPLFPLPLYLYALTNSLNTHGPYLLIHTTRHDLPFSCAALAYHQPICKTKQKKAFKWARSCRPSWWPASRAQPRASPRTRPVFVCAETCPRRDEPYVHKNGLGGGSDRFKSTNPPVACRCSAAGRASAAPRPRAAPPPAARPPPPRLFVIVGFGVGGRKGEAVLTF